MPPAPAEIEEALAKIRAVIEGVEPPAPRIQTERERQPAIEPSSMAEADGEERPRARPQDGDGRLIRAELHELAAWLGLSLESTRERVGLNTAKGRWKVVRRDDAPARQFVEMPVADLNWEIDLVHDRGRRQSGSDQIAPQDAPQVQDGGSEEEGVRETLIEAHARLLAMQEELRAARAELAAMQAERELLRRIGFLVDEWRSRPATGTDVSG